MIKTKYLLYAFKSKNYKYWYETDSKYFQEKRPSPTVLSRISLEQEEPEEENINKNPWNHWDTNDVQKIMNSDGICINYLKSTNNDFIQKSEDLKLLELYDYLVSNFDISRAFGFNTIKIWHKEVFKSIYPFAGDLRTVEMSKGSDTEAWTWRLSFLEAIPKLNDLIKEISAKEYESLDDITIDLSKLLSEFLFIHPFREGNGRISRLLSDIILAKNGFPMIGLNLKDGDNYIQKIHQGYDFDYEPLQELLKLKIEEITNG